MEVAIGNLLKKMRLNKGLSQNQMAKKMGYTQSGLSRREKGEIATSLQDAMIWANKTGCTEMLKAFVVDMQPYMDMITSMPTVVSFISPLLPFVA